MRAFQTGSRSEAVSLPPAGRQFPSPSIPPMHLAERRRCNRSSVARSNQAEIAKGLLKAYAPIAGPPVARRRGWHVVPARDCVWPLTSHLGCAAYFASRRSEARPLPSGAWPAPMSPPAHAIAHYRLEHPIGAKRGQALRCDPPWGHGLDEQGLAVVGFGRLSLAPAARGTARRCLRNERCRPPT